MIVIAASGCDNVEWGGVDVRLQPPPPADYGAAADSLGAAEDTSAFRLPTGPVLYVAEYVDSALQVVPVGEIAGDSLVPFPDEAAAPGFRATFARDRMPAGTEYTLFAEGTRVGTLSSTEIVTDESFCTPRPAARGPVELVPPAVESRRFLALVEEDAEGFTHGSYEAVQDDRGQRIAGLNLTAELIPQVGARWPTDLVAARGDMQAFRLDESGTPAFAATFLFRDQLDTSSAQSSSWAMFILGLLQGESYTPAFVWYREAGREGKGAARFFEQLDWDRDGQAEILLEVLGEGDRWFAAVARKGDQWVRVFQDPCGANAEPVAADGE